MFLHFLGTNTFYHVVRDAQGPSAQTVCQTVRRVASAMYSLRREVIRWPENCETLSRQFYQTGQFPSVAGCLDGTHVPVKAPKKDEGSFLNRKQRHAINVMGVCGPQFELYFLSANHGGRCHDSRVLKTTKLWTKFERGDLPFPGAVLLGDSGYPLRSWLMTPILGNTDDRNTLRFNAAHAKTRNLIERTFGIMKNRFNILQTGIRVRSMKLAAKLIVCCGILHNLAIQHGDTCDDPDVEENLQPTVRATGPPIINQDPAEDDPSGRLRRARLLVHFTRNN